jgi:hypothetical protein
VSENGNGNGQKGEKAPPTLALLQERLEYLETARRVATLESLAYEWDGFGGSDILERLYRERYGESGLWRPLTINFAGDRSEGRKWPLWSNLTELNVIRGQARLLYATNPYAAGHVNRLVDYTIGKGYTYRAQPLKPRDVSGTPGMQVAPEVKELVGQTQKWLDGWLSLNRWTASAVPHEHLTTVGDTREEEAAQRVWVDGEVTFRLYKIDEPAGMSLVRFVEPVGIDYPSGSKADGWSFGIKSRTEPFVDEETVEAIGVKHRDATGVDQWEEVPGSQIVRILPRGENLSVKRGTPLLSFGTADAHERAYKLQSNASKSAAYRAATAEVWEHATGTATTIGSLAQSQGGTATGANGQGYTYEGSRTPPPWVRRIPSGQKAVTPTDVGYEGYLNVEQADLRQAGASTASPEFMISGDASNNNFASIKEAGTPFVVAAAVIRKAMRIAVDAGVLPEEALTAVEIQVEGHKDDTRTPLERAQEDQILVSGIKVKSRKTCQLERNLDPEIEDQNIQEDEQKFPPGGGMGGLLGVDGGPPGGGPSPLDDLFGPGGGTETPAQESLLESADPFDAVALLESFSGMITDRAGRHRYYRDGHPVKGPSLTMSGEGGRPGKGRAPRPFVPPSTPAEAVGWLTRVGKATDSLEGELKAWGNRQLDRLDPRLTTAVKGFLKLSFASYTGAQKAVAAVTAERGFTPEQTQTLGRWLAGLDVVFGAKGLPFAVKVAGGGGFASLASSFVPAASVAYLAYSTARDPLATLRAAKVGVAAALGRRTAQESEDASAPGLPAILADRYAVLDDFDTWMAWFLCGLDETGGDVAASLDAADNREVTAQESEGPPAGDEAPDADTPQARAEAIADILLGLFGDELALMMQESREAHEAADITAALQESFSGTITDKLGRKLHYVNGKRVKGPEDGAPSTPEGRAKAAQERSQAVDAAHQQIKAILGGKKTPEAAQTLASHLATLTVAQLHGIRKAHNLSASGPLKEKLVAKLADRLSRGRMDAKVEEQPRTERPENGKESTQPDKQQGPEVAQQEKSGTPEPKPVPSAAQKTAEKPADREPWQQTKAEWESKNQLSPAIWKELRDKAEYVDKSRPDHLIVTMPTPGKEDHTRVVTWDNRGPLGHTDVADDQLDDYLTKFAYRRGHKVLKVEGGIGGTFPSANYAGAGFVPDTKGAKGVRSFTGPPEAVEWMTSRLASGGYKTSVHDVPEAIPEEPGVKANRGESKLMDHSVAVERAVADGKPVPPEVLADYPDLQAKGAPAQTAPQQTPSKTPTSTPSNAPSPASTAAALAKVATGEPSVATADAIHAAYERSKGMTDEDFAATSTVIDAASQDDLRVALDKMKMRYKPGDSRTKLAAAVKALISGRRGAAAQMAQIGPHPYSAPPGQP